LLHSQPVLTPTQQKKHPKLIEADKRNGPVVEQM
jgi:hypothetical protein